MLLLDVGAAGVFGIRRKRTEERFNAEFAENAECAEKRGEQGSAGRLGRGGLRGMTVPGGRREEGNWGRGDWEKRARFIVPLQREGARSCSGRKMRGEELAP